LISLLENGCSRNIFLLSKNYIFGMYTRAYSHRDGPAYRQSPKDELPRRQQKSNIEEMKSIVLRREEKNKMKKKIRKYARTASAPAAIKHEQYEEMKSIVGKKK
jgi:hypothetical protein